jgi:hypothetical protein
MPETYTVDGEEVVVTSECRITRRELNARLDSLQWEKAQLIAEFTPRRDALTAQIDALKAVKAAVPL